MKKIHLVIVNIAVLSLFLLSGCGEDGDGKIEMKEPRKDLSEMPQGNNWSVTDVEGYGE